VANPPPRASEIAFAKDARFQLLSQLGKGGMGVVYEAFDRARSSRVALKTLHGHHSPEAILRFKNEFRAIADLDHPNLVSLGELFEHNGQWFFTMEAVDGVSFIRWVRPAAADGARPATAVTDVRTPPPETPPGPLPPPREPPRAGEFDLARLRAGLAQLASALYALHAAGNVHRDIKPSNVLVTREGRVVLLDFGLVTTVGRGESWAHGGGVGTPDYMAPEQAVQGQVGAEADWYSVGVMLFQALTGRLPFEGPPLEVISNKQRFEPRPPSLLASGVPADLDALCVDLLAFAPERRPSGGAVLRRLGVDIPAAPLGAAPGSITQAQPFVGRQRELDALWGALEDCRRGAPVTVFVHGESGVGKSALVRRFVERVAAEVPGMLPLAGRCYEREWVPIKAFDGITEELVRHLRTLPEDELAALAPPDAALLAQAFPAFRRLGGVAFAPRFGAPASVDAQELRPRVFAALRELLARLAQRAPLLLVIDDLQWADADSMALLEEVVRPPHAPALLLVATLRSTRDDEAGAQRAGSLTGARRLELDRLPPGDAADLAKLLLARAMPDAAASAADLAEEANGHPLFIAELVLHSAAQGEHAPGVRRLEDALWTRVDRLDAPTRRLLELVSVAGSPLPRDVLAQALGEDPTRAVALLAAVHLVRRTGARDADAVEPYHDRVREAVLGRLAAAAQCEHHRRLALALESWGRGDLEAVAVHWRAAGEHARAAHFAALAAPQAAAALAFDRAARLYRVALEVRDVQLEPQKLRAGLAHVLASAGRGMEAAKAFLEATEGANAAQALDLRRRAAEQLLCSGHIDEGIEAFSAVLAEVGMKAPATPRRALASLLLRRVQLRLRGLGFTRRDESQIAPEVLTRIDTCWSVATGLSIVDPIRGADFQARHLLLALDAGEPYRIARALSVEACFVSTQGAPARARTAALVGAAQDMARQTGHPHARGWAMSASSLAAYQTGEWAPARVAAEQARHLFREHCTGVAWELHTIELFELWSLYYLGEIATVSERVPVLLRAALERGDLYAAATLRTGLNNMAWLAGGDLAAAARETREALRQWSPSGFHVQHYLQLLAEGHIDLYAGEPAASYRRVSEQWSALERSLLLRVQIVRAEALHLRARLALGAARGAGPARRRDLLRVARRDARRIAGERLRPCPPLAALLEAGIAALGGDAAGALAQAGAAARGFAGADMPLYAAAARRRQGALLGGSAGAALCAQADATMAAQGIVDPPRMTAVLAPGFD